MVQNVGEIIMDSNLRKKRSIPPGSSDKGWPSFKSIMDTVLSKNHVDRDLYVKTNSSEGEENCACKGYMTDGYVNAFNFS